MIPLLVLTALLLFLSGAIKLRAAARGQIGVHLPSVLELLGGVGLLLRMSTPPVPVEQGMVAAVAAVVLVVVSSLHLGRRLAQRRRVRDLTEARRLESYVKLKDAMQDKAGPGGMGGVSGDSPA